MPSDYELDVIMAKLRWGANGEFSAMIEPKECAFLLKVLDPSAGEVHPDQQALAVSPFPEPAMDRIDKGIDWLGRVKDDE